MQGRTARRRLRGCRGPGTITIDSDFTEVLHRMAEYRHPGIHEADTDRVLLVTKHKITGAERCDWWPSVEEAERSDMIVLEVRERIKIEKHKNNWTGLASVLNGALGKSGTTLDYTRRRSLDQREFFESIDDKKKKTSV